MKKAMLPALVVMVAALTIPLSEVVLATWMSISPLDVTGNFFLLGILPAELGAVAI